MMMLLMKMRRNVNSGGHGCKLSSDTLIQIDIVIPTGRVMVVLGRHFSSRRVGHMVR